MACAKAFCENGEVSRAVLLVNREELKTILSALNIAGNTFSNTEVLSKVYDDLHDEIDRMVFTND